MYTNTFRFLFALFFSFTAAEAFGEVLADESSQYQESAEPAESNEDVRRTLRLCEHRFTEEINKNVITSKSGLYKFVDEFLYTYPECRLPEPYTQNLLGQYPQTPPGQQKERGQEVKSTNSLSSWLLSVYESTPIPYTSLTLYYYLGRYLAHKTFSAAESYLAQTVEAQQKHALPGNSTLFEEAVLLKNCFLESRKDQCAYRQTTGIAISVFTAIATGFIGWKFLLHPEWTPSGLFLAVASLTGVVSTAWWGGPQMKQVLIGLYGLAGYQVLSNRFYSMQATSRFASLLMGSYLFNSILSQSVQLGDRGYWYIFRNISPAVFYVSLAAVFASVYQYLTHLGISEQQLIIIGSSTFNLLITAVAAIGVPVLEQMFSGDLQNLQHIVMHERFHLILAYGSVVLLSMLPVRATTGVNVLAPLLQYFLFGARLLGNSQRPLFDRPDNFDPLGVLVMNVLLPSLMVYLSL